MIYIDWGELVGALTLASAWAWMAYRRGLDVGRLRELQRISKVLDRGGRP